MERCGKINAVNSSSESWTGIGVVTGFAAVMLITSGPHVKKMDAHHGINLLHILQEVRRIGKTRNQLYQNAFEQAELILWAAIDPAIARRARRGELVRSLDHFDLLQTAIN
jgi:hypothetical protein